MCGIFGAAFLASNEPMDLEAAIASLRHRGPDEFGRFHADRVILGHARLRVIDLSQNARQPMVSTSGEVAIVYNGEIYNYRELRTELIQRGHKFRSHCDTEVIIKGYLEWGERIVNRLDGMFAFGIWDGRSRKLFLARDHFGKKPLFYALRGNGIRFASEIKAIVASGWPAEPEIDALPSLFAFGTPHAPRTMYRGVYQLPPASTLTITEGKEPVVHRFWQAPLAEPKLDVPVEEAIAEVRGLVTAAVACRLEADVPIGAFLSGGVDSTIVVALMARLLGQRVKTFAIGFTGDHRYNETEYARKVSQAFDTEHHELAIDPSAIEHLPRLVEMHDGPFGDSSAIPMSVVSSLARKHATVALTGDGGDELFCGYIRFLAAEATEWVPEPLRRVGGVAANLIPAGREGASFRSKAKRFLRKSQAPLFERLLSWQGYFDRDLRDVLHPDVYACVPVNEPRDLSYRMLAGASDASALSKVLLHNMETYLPDDLMVKADRSSMMHSLEVRSPLLDTDLADYVARLPDKFKRHHGTTKWILKEAFPDLISEEIRDRSKMGFGMPLGTWFRTSLKGYLYDHLAKGARIYEYVNEDYVERILSEQMNSVADHSHGLWLLLTLEIWLNSIARSTTYTAQSA